MTVTSMALAGAGLTPVQEPVVVCAAHRAGDAHLRRRRRRGRRGRFERGELGGDLIPDRAAVGVGHLLGLRGGHRAAGDAGSVVGAERDQHPVPAVDVGGAVLGLRSERLHLGGHRRIHRMTQRRVIIVQTATVAAPSLAETV
ncbi:MAG: hypothetical protein F4107_07560 [Gemmatimonadetes bacterium]|nr:hypothetical protein [Acidimicrobiaceae bacterium]MYI65777.1 hypothetical protein [Gemmatimonadota bacterium]